MNPALSGLIAALSWGTHDFAARFVAQGIGYVNAVLGVTLAGIGWLGLYILVFGEVITLSADIWLAAVSGGVFALATMWLFAALAIGPVAVVAPIVGAFPIYNVAFAVMQGAQPDPLTWAAMAAVISGVVVVARYDPAAGGEPKSWRPRFSPALAFSFASGFCFAVSFIVGQQATVILGEVQTVFIGRFFGLAVIVAVLLQRAEAPRLPVRWWPVFVGMGALDAIALVSVVAAGHT
ncbi:MAG: hypothetical protein R3316_04855, partial [Rhodovibrionaceae bacterium]|nr:hypothetical protein [Rhodovibrionaceae bacterium]